MGFEFSLDETDSSITSHATGLQRPLRTEGDSVESVKRYIKDAFGDALGYYARMQLEATHHIGRSQMAEEIDWIVSRGVHFDSAELLSEAARLLKLYSSWYCYSGKGEDKAAPLKRAVGLVEQAISLTPDSRQLHLQLATLLVGSPQVRDLEKGRRILEGKLFQGDMPERDRNSVKALLDTLDRWQGVAAIIDPEFSYDRLSFYPLGQLANERTTCRATIRKFKKEKDVDQLRPVLEHLYRIAILYEIAQRLILKRTSNTDMELERLKSNASRVREFSYKKNGRIKAFIEAAPVLTKSDYLAFEFVWGPAAGILDPMVLLG